MDSELKLSKLDVAKRQLETVCRLYFWHGDPVSIHTLTSAAYNVVRDLNSHRGGEEMFAKDGFLKRIKRGHEKEVRALINAAENFFKHADRDHEEIIDFKPALSEFMILEACSVYSRLSGEWPPLFRLYQLWFIANHPDLFNFPEKESNILNLDGKKVVALGRQEFFRQSLTILERPYA